MGGRRHHRTRQFGSCHISLRDVSWESWPAAGRNLRVMEGSSNRQLAQRSRNRRLIRDTTSLSTPPSWYSQFASRHLRDQMGLRALRRGKVRSARQIKLGAVVSEHAPHAVQDCVRLVPSTVRRSPVNFDYPSPVCQGLPGWRPDIVSRVEVREVRRRCSTCFPSESRQFVLVRPRYQAKLSQT